MNTTSLKNPFHPLIRIIEEDYEIPQLGRKRRISALLPYDYEDSDIAYPVLYLHDGQNLFNEDAPFGNWAIDKSLAALAEQGKKDLIIIAVDHGGEDRVVEYSPYSNRRFGQGQGELYLQFVLDTLKPYVDRKFRVLPEREHTGIGGSSMGGLISLHAGMVYPEVFSKMMIFSPSLWISPKIFYHTSNFMPTEPAEIYVYAGGEESHEHLPNIKRLESTLVSGRITSSLIRFHLSFDPDGEHGEAYWAKEFPKALEWLYFQPQ